MATKIDDPLTNTTWLDTGDIPGSLMTIVMGAVGIGMLFTIMGIGRSTVQPLIASLLDPVPGVQSSQDTGLIVEG